MYMTQCEEKVCNVFISKIPWGGGDAIFVDSSLIGSNSSFTHRKIEWLRTTSDYDGIALGVSNFQVFKGNY